MKILIWFGCCILHYILSSIIKPIVYQIPTTDDRSILLVSSLYGILIGASFGLCFWLAKFLCKKWDLHKTSKKAAKDDPVHEIKPEVVQTPLAPVEKVAHNTKPAKKVRSTKPLIIVTYVLLIAIIIALSVFCVLSVKNLKNTISQLETNITVLEGDLKVAENNLKRKESALNIANAKISDNNRLLQNKINELKTAQSDIEYWKNKYIDADSANVTYSYEFSSVNALITAIKKNPEAYHNKQVKVFGMLLTYEGYDSNKDYVKFLSLFDYNGENVSFNENYEARSFYYNKIEAKQAIDVTLSSDLQYTVAETGDYVNLYGTVKITNGEIYLDKCQYN